MKISWPLSVLQARGSEVVDDNQDHSLTGRDIGVSRLSLQGCLIVWLLEYMNIRYDCNQGCSEHICFNARGPPLRVRTALAEPIQGACAIATVEPQGMVLSSFLQQPHLLSYRCHRLFENLRVCPDRVKERFSHTTFRRGCIARYLWPSRRTASDTMAYSDDAVKAKLSSLNETQDSIVTVAQWIMFHRRHADRTASLWLTRLQESQSTNKRLNLIYLANEVVQQSRARSKQDFLLAFEPLIAEATSMAYKGANQDIQGKLRRVVEVWRQRQIFDPRIQEQTEKRLEEIDKKKSGKSFGESGGRLGGSLFGGGGGVNVPTELDGVSKSVAAVSRAEASAKASVHTAEIEFEKQMDQNAPLPSAPMRAARLRGLSKDLMAAQSAVEASIRARKEMLASLEKLIESHHARLSEDETTASDISTKIEGIESTIKDVEDSIMRGQDTPTPISNGNSNNNSIDPERPEPEGFTPPPADDDSTEPQHDEGISQRDTEPLIGDGTTLESSYTNTTGAEPIQEIPPDLNEPPPAFEPPSALDQQDPATAAKEFLESLSLPQARPAQTTSADDQSPSDPRMKRRKLSHKTSNDMDDEIFSTGDLGGVDEDGVSAILGR